MDRDYVNPILEHIRECVDDLDEPPKINEQRDLNPFEYRAAEGDLQVLIESAVGFAKNWIKDNTLFRRQYFATITGGIRIRTWSQPNEFPEV